MGQEKQKNSTRIKSKSSPFISMRTIINSTNENENANKKETLTKKQKNATLYIKLYKKKIRFEAEKEKRGRKRASLVSLICTNVRINTYKYYKYNG